MRTDIFAVMLLEERGPFMKTAFIELRLRPVKFRDSLTVDIVPLSAVLASELARDVILNKSVCSICIPNRNAQNDARNSSFPLVVR